MSFPKEPKNYVGITRERNFIDDNIDTTILSSGEQLRDKNKVPRWRFKLMSEQAFLRVSRQEVKEKQYSDQVQTSEETTKKRERNFIDDNIDTTLKQVGDKNKLPRRKYKLIPAPPLPLKLQEIKEKQYSDKVQEVKEKRDSHQVQTSEATTKKRERNFIEDKIDDKNKDLSDFSWESKQEVTEKQDSDQVQTSEQEVKEKQDSDQVQTSEQEVKEEQDSDQVQTSEATTKTKEE